MRLPDGGFLVTPTNASLGFLDPARLSRLDPQAKLVSGDAPTKEIPLHSALYETRSSAGAIVHLHSTHSVAVSMLPEIDPKAVLPPMTAYYLMRVGQTALVSYYRPGDAAVAGAIRGLAGRYWSVSCQSRASRCRQLAGRRRVRDRGTGGDCQALSAPARTRIRVISLRSRSSISCRLSDSRCPTPSTTTKRFADAIPGTTIIPFAGICRSPRIVPL